MFSKVAAETPALSLEEEPLVFTLAEVPPWAWKDEEHNPQGLLVDLIEAIRQKTRLPIEYKLRPHSRAILELSQGQADYSILFESPRSEAIGERIANVVRMEILLVGYPLMDDEAAPPRSLDDLSGKPVGYIRGTYYGEAFAHHTGIERVAVNDTVHGMRLLQHGRLRAMVGTDVAFSQADALKREVGAEVLFSLSPAAGNIYLSRRSDRGDTVPLIQRAVESLHESGQLETIFSKRLEVAR